MESHIISSKNYRARGYSIKTCFLALRAINKYNYSAIKCENFNLAHLKSQKDGLLKGAFLCHVKFLKVISKEYLF